MGAALNYPLLSEWAVKLGLAALLFGPYFFIQGFRAWWKKRLIENLPTSAARSVAMGLAELEGKAVPLQSLTAPYSGLPCVMYRYKVEKQIQTSKGPQLTVLGQGQVVRPFTLEDKTGGILVDPEASEIRLSCRFDTYLEEHPIPGRVMDQVSEPKKSSGLSWTTSIYRVREWYMAPGDDVYVLGSVTKRLDLWEERKKRLNKRLAELKKDAEKLARFDANRDGTIDALEWDKARLEEEQRLLDEELADTTGKAGDISHTLVVRKEAPHNVLLISESKQTRLLSKLGIYSTLAAWGGAAATVWGLSWLSSVLALIGLRQALDIITQDEFLVSDTLEFLAVCLIYPGYFLWRRLRTPQTRILEGGIS